MLASTRIAACPGGAMLYRECAETAKFDTITPCQRSRDLIKNRIHDILKVSLIEARVVLRDALNEFRFYH